MTVTDCRQIVQHATFGQWMIELMKIVSDGMASVKQSRHCSYAALKSRDLLGTGPRR